MVITPSGKKRTAKQNNPFQTGNLSRIAKDYCSFEGVSIASPHLRLVGGGKALIPILRMK
jgi:hypothetical protein